MSQAGAPERRRLDRILRPDFAEGLGEMNVAEIRRRRDECLAEREYLSYLRRLIHGRIEILRDEVAARGGGKERDPRPLVERLSDILSADSPQGPARGEYVRLGLPEDEMANARRRLERLVNDAAISDPSSLADGELDGAIRSLVDEEREVSDLRHKVLQLHDVFQDEVKRRYKERLSS